MLKFLHERKSKNDRVATLERVEYTMIAAKLDQLLWRIPREAPAHEQVRIIETSCASIRVRDTGGRNQALIFLCDPPVTVEAYDELIVCFRPNHRVIIIELPSFGFSKISNASALTFEGALRQTEETIKLLNLDACVVFGPCICGFLAAKLVARAELPVKGLVLMQTPDKEAMLSWVKRVDPKGFLRVPLVGQLLVRFTARRMANFWINYATAKGFDATNLANASDRALAQGGGYPLASMLQFWSTGTKNANLNVPALAIWGKQDRSHKETASLSTCKHVPNAEVIEFANCGHFAELEQPKQFANAVAQFINSCLTSDDDSE